MEKEKALTFKITLEDKPHLAKAFAEEKGLAGQIVRTFTMLMDEAFNPDNAIRWADLPKKLHKDLDFAALIGGILHGALDLKEMNPDAYEALKEEVHPLSMLQSRKNYLDGGMKSVNWRAHFRLPEESVVNQDTVTQIIRNLLRYSKYVKIEDLRVAMEANQIATYRGLGEVEIAKLPFLPAIRYQQKKFGDLHAGVMLPETGFFDCGPLEHDGPECPACKRQSLQALTETITACPDCNAGFTEAIPHGPE